MTVDGSVEDNPSEELPFDIAIREDVERILSRWFNLETVLSGGLGVEKRVRRCDVAEAVVQGVEDAIRENERVRLAKLLTDPTRRRNVRPLSHRCKGKGCKWPVPLNEDLCEECANALGGVDQETPT